MISVLLSKSMSASLEKDALTQNNISLYHLGARHRGLEVGGGTPRGTIIAKRPTHMMDPIIPT
jgi:hypothetical protein